MTTMLTWEMVLVIAVAASIILGTVISYIIGYAEKEPEEEHGHDRPDEPG